jgi:ketosteroid isomerase-like protein
MRRIATLLFAAMCAGPALADRPQEISADLQSLVNAERAFAKRATVIGWRDAFLEFFSEDAVAVAVTPERARDRLLQQPSRPFSVAELTWEPRTGAVAASGELGWLTGTSTSIDHSAPEPKPRHGNYLSVWRRTGNGDWRVFIDVGVGTPDPVAFEPGFKPFGSQPSYRGHDPRERSAGSLMQADRDLNARIAAEGSAPAAAAVFAAGGRLHRPGMITIVGRDRAASGDLGYSYGAYTLKGDAPESGGYLRVWHRDAAGKWWIVADVAQPAVRR